MPNPVINRRTIANRVSGSNIDPEVSDWVARVIANGGSVSQSTSDAADVFMKALKSANIRNKIYRLNFYAGTGDAAAKTPLIKDIGSATESWVNPTFLTYTEATGLTSSGGAGFISTGATLASLYNIDGTNHAMSYGLYVRSSSNASSLEMGTYDGANFSYLSVANSALTYFSMTDNSAGISAISDSNGHGFYLGVRLSTSSMKLYKNGSQFATTTTPGSLTSSVITIYVHGVNDQNTGNATAVSSRTLGGYQLSIDFDATQQLALYNAWQAFQTALGRQV